jgi:hypothetical protein
VLLEDVGGIACSLWVSHILKGQVEAAMQASAHAVDVAAAFKPGLGGRGGFLDAEASATARFAPLALASLAVITYLRQNLVVRESLGFFTWLGYAEAPRSDDSPFTHALRRTEGGQRASMRVWLLMLLTSLPGQLLAVVAYLAYVSHGRLTFTTCAWIVAYAVALPCAVMVAVKAGRRVMQWQADGG